MNDLRINSALISVFSKQGIEPIVEELSKNDVKIYSTGGTYKYISELGYNVTEVENVTDYPSIFGGRVKTLHPKIFGGILYRRDNKNDIEEKEKFDIPSIDLVIVDLYPFEESFKSGSALADMIENKKTSINVDPFSPERSPALCAPPNRDRYAPPQSSIQTHGPVRSTLSGH